MDRLLPSDERPSVPDTIGDAIARAVTSGVSEQYALRLIHVHRQSDRIIDAQPVIDPYGCHYCDDDPAAATDY